MSSLTNSGPFCRRTAAAAQSEQPKPETGAGLGAETERWLVDVAAYPDGNEDKRGIGLFSAFFLTFNRIVETGIFATSSTIFSLSGQRLHHLIRIIKLVIVLLVVVSGWAALGGALKVPNPHDFDNAFAGTTGSASITEFASRKRRHTYKNKSPAQMNAERIEHGSRVVMARYNVIRSHIGYSNAKLRTQRDQEPYPHAERSQPQRLLSSFPSSTCFVNIAHFAAVPKEQIISAGRILAASSFHNVFATASRGRCPCSSRSPA
ncbi:hypothetical protein G647_07588 [Cladophialophora carrionii CBS 160.54]|uniref:Uncharacterized protein n=1 Tax=Cladophialophora carrionii CBS 160.54 TaxID=1279043 RepID=V9D4M4_9EURO|nr:uncharacterized protein G647_07588 [Cladophialophora carrionii CBS 160.54]ETI21243.1 hypothetical protein G647_07588 [Cladophialophora carrionii CBS 160.54]